MYETIGTKVRKTVLQSTTTNTTRKPCLQYTHTDEKCYNVTGENHYDEVELCDNCLEWYQFCFPQGWVSYPGDTCKHGTYVGGCGIDYMCNACEDGDYQLLTVSFSQKRKEATDEKL